MTCIVGLIEKETVYIAGDSAGVSGLDVTIRKDTKVFKVGEFVIGCTTSFRMINLIRFSFSPPTMSEGEDVYKYMCTRFIDALRSTFSNGGWLEKDKNIELGGTFLVGFRGRLFTIHNDFQVGESIEPFHSVGCGFPYAMAVMKCLESSDLHPLERLKQALEIATYYSGGVRPPFVFESTKIE